MSSRSRSRIPSIPRGSTAISPRPQIDAGRLLASQRRVGCLHSLRCTRTRRTLVFRKGPTVQPHDGRTFPSTVLAHETVLDLAVPAVEGAGLAPLPLGNATSVRDRRVVHAVACWSLPVMRWVAEEETGRVLSDLFPPHARVLLSTAARLARGRSILPVAVALRAPRPHLNTGGRRSAHMNRTIIAIAGAAGLVFGTSAVAQTPAQASSTAQTSSDASGSAGPKAGSTSKAKKSAKRSSRAQGRRGSPARSADASLPGQPRSGQSSSGSNSHVNAAGPGSIGSPGEAASQSRSGSSGTGAAMSGSASGATGTTGSTGTTGMDNSGATGAPGASTSPATPATNAGPNGATSNTSPSGSQPGSSATSTDMR